MKDIVIPAAYGNKTKTVVITQPNGAGDCYQILIDRYYQGIITKRKSEWVAFLNAKSELTEEDVLIIGDLIENSED